MRDIGSGNIGATNVLRAGGKGLAAATLVLDCLKATAAILLAGAAVAGTESFAAAGALIGHLYPVWLRFKGGKGVATLLGMLIPLLPVARGDLCRGLARPAADGPNLVGGGHGRRGQRADQRRHPRRRPISSQCCSVSRCWCVWKHRANLARLKAGTEPALGKDKA